MCGHEYVHERSGKKKPPRRNSSLSSRVDLCSCSPASCPRDPFFFFSYSTSAPPSRPPLSPPLSGDTLRLRPISLCLSASSSPALPPPPLCAPSWSLRSLTPSLSLPPTLSFSAARATLSKVSALVYAPCQATIEDFFFFRIWYTFSAVRAARRAAFAIQAKEP